MNGKGSKPRPLSISYEKFSDNYNNIFRKKECVVEVKELPNGDQFIEIPDYMMEHLSWKAGDTIIWTDENDGTYKLTKK